MHGSVCNLGNPVTEFPNIEPQIPSSLKFVISNIRHIVPTQLSNDNCLAWHIQILKLFSANGFVQYLDGTLTPPTRLHIGTSGLSENNPTYNHWLLIDQILAAPSASPSQQSSSHTFFISSQAEKFGSVWNVCCKHPTNPKYYSSRTNFITSL
ncbi:hypothetical protein MA16_Dca009660 [Dendrobium catenatum]|uniref:Retrovirus-related Pol polyprotein from transposon TNT 1-94 n=1 Tax=Dendrobium catenatum TaxID=906689 RepID=A0A2I0VSN3_9ASPA|nr:hypothetical protein MA16_Dca009660 [Dendrobium catenatum]